MSIHHIFALFLTFLSSFAIAQDEVIVYFSDKEGSEFDPYAYFDPKAIERRTNCGIDLYDISDFPVSEIYKTTIKDIGILPTGESRWLNAIFCFANSDQIIELLDLPFVSSIEFLPESELMISGYSENESLVVESKYTSDILKGQKAIHGGSYFAESDLDGTGIRIAIFDVGFNYSNVIPELMHLYRENRIIDTHDFVRKKSLDYTKGGTHGTNVLSCIAGKKEDVPLGFGPGAEFLLARTEKALTEKLKEEKYWLMAAEWADKNGADIINSSLGYTRKRYYQTEMDGKTALVTRAANFAASKGMLVVNAAGNEGDDSWKTIGAPADSDSVLAVGGVQARNGLHIGWSSYGPSADKRIKPNVCAFGNVMVADKNLGVHASTGTSFSSPLMAGFAACVLQKNPTWSGIQLMTEIEKSGHLYPYFDYAHGYGLPQASYFINPKDAINSPKTFNIEEVNEVLYVTIAHKFIPEFNYTGDEISESEQEVDYANLTSDFLYYHIENSEGYLSNYKVNNINSEKGASINLKGLAGNTIRIYFKNYYYEYEIK